MKVNFWQILGGILIILGVIFAFRQRTGTDDTVQPPPPPPPPAATAPAA